MVAHSALGGSAVLGFLTLLACSTFASATNEPLQVGCISNKNQSLCSYDKLKVPSLPPVVKCGARV